MLIAQSSRQELIDFLSRRYFELDSEEIQILAETVFTSYEQSNKSSAIKILLKNSYFMEWSTREIARVLGCSATIVGQIRRSMEARGECVRHKSRSYFRDKKKISISIKSRGENIFDFLRGTSLVYVVESGNTGFFKIGYTNDLAKRLKMISCGCPQAPSVRYYLICKNNSTARNMEALIHKTFENKQVRRNAEWFTLDTQEISRIKELAEESHLNFCQFVSSSDDQPQGCRE